MKKLYYIILLHFWFISVLAQNAKKEQIVLNANEKKNTTLVFPTAIKKAVVGSSDFKFGYNKTELSNIGLLKAIEGEESNLIVITENGNVFSFILRYKIDNDGLPYLIKDDMAIGNENGNIVSKNKKEEEKETSNSGIIKEITINDFQNSGSLDSLNVYNKYALGEIDKTPFYNRIYGAKNKIGVKLKNISYIDNDLYFSLILTNESTLDYDINYLNYYIMSRNKKKNTTSQTIPYRSKYIYNLPKRLKSNDEVNVVFVFSKFTINENKVLLVEMTEDNGERIVKLEIPNTFINNPN